MADTVLVTGAAGLMGSSLLQRLKETDIQVRAVFHQQKPNLTASNIEYVQGDLRDRTFCKSVMKDVKYAYLFAGLLSTAPVIAKNPVSPVVDNVIMTMQCLEAAYFGGVQKCLWLSSTTGYPEKEGPLTEADMECGEPPESYYAVGMMSRYLETQCRLFSEKLNRKMPVIVLRPTNLYGEFETFDPGKSHVLPALVKKIVDRENPLDVWGTGEQTRDLVYAGDVADACLTAMEQLNEFVCFNVGSGNPVSVNEMIKEIMKQEGNPKLEVRHDLSRASGVQKREFSLEEIGQRLGFHAQTPFNVGVGRVIREYRRQKDEKR